MEQAITFRVNLSKYVWLQAAHGSGSTVKSTFSIVFSRYNRLVEG